MRFYSFFIILLFFTPYGSSSHSVPEHISNKPLYDFLDELANDQLIDLVSVIKPYSRPYIAGKLNEADRQRERLSIRQRRELDMYLDDFAMERNTAVGSRLALVQMDTTFLWSLLPPTFNYRDSLFRFNLKPIYGIRYFTNDNGNIRHTWGGLAVNAYIGNNWAVWASLRDNQQMGSRLARPLYLTQELGGNYKGVTGGGVGGEYSEMRAGISWSWEWGNLSLEKDHLEWGDNYNGASILSGRTPSYAMIKLQMSPSPWLDFIYHHGWLVSQVVDSVHSYFPVPGDPLKTFYQNKYIAANMFNITPIERFNISVGNSIIYSERTVQPIYMIPFMFFKSAVHTQTAGVRGHNHNSAFFVNVSSRQIKHLHLYGTWFVDEFSITRIRDDDRTNFTSTKAGFRLSNWPMNNVAMTVEYTYTFPKTFQHRTPVTTYETNNFNLGHYLRDNSRELYLGIQLKTVKGLLLEVSYLKAEKGNVVPYVYNSPMPVDSDPFMDEVVWSNNTFAFKSRYLFFNNFSAFIELYSSDIRGYDVDGRPSQDYLNMFTPDLFHGKNNTMVFGVQLGF
jgi:hypothetical protein